MALTATAVKNAKFTGKPRKVYDRDGLYLQITPTSKLWRGKYRVTIDGKRKEKVCSLGRYPDLSLKQAREQWMESKALGDPNAAKKAQKHHEYQHGATTLEAVARQWFAHHRDTGGKGGKPLSAKHAGEVIRSLENHIFPKLGNMPIDEIKWLDIKGILRPLSKGDDKTPGKGETASRILQRLESIFEEAVEDDLISVNPASGKLKRKRLYRQQVVNQAVMPVSELGAFKQKLDNYQGDPETRLAILLTIYTTTRTSEVLEARWEEIDDGLWVIPSSRMKAGVEHGIPLSTQARRILWDLRLLTGHQPYLFPNRVQRPKNPCMSNNTMLQALIRLGYGKNGGCHATMHGFRSMFSTWANDDDAMKWSSSAIERQLAHGEPDKVKDSYDKGKRFAERTRLVQYWADWFDAQ